jgi:putative tryptophan/tyrosine transport system substrate-binding protein
MIRRRAVIALLGGAAAWPLAARGQRQNGRMAQIAFLNPSSPQAWDPHNMEQFKQGLVENGLVEGRNITIDYVWAEGNQERLGELATALAQRNLDVIVTAGPQPIRALLTAGTRTPIVFAIHSDPVGDGIVESLARPGGNVTGLSMANSNLESKRLEVLKDAFSALKRVMILHDPTMRDSGLADAHAGASALALETLIVEAPDPGQFEAAFADATKQGVNGLATMASPFLNFHRKRLIELAAHHRLPSIWESTVFVRDGGLLSYGPDRVDTIRRAATYVDRILRGEKPGDLPVQFPSKFEMVVNLKTAKLDFGQF